MAETDHGDGVVPERVRVLRRNGLALALAAAAVASVLVGLVGASTTQAVFMVILAIAFTALAVTMLRGWTPPAVIGPALLLVFLPGFLGFAAWQIATLETGSVDGDLARVLLVAFQATVGLSAAAYFVLETRRAVVVSLVTLVGLHLAIVGVRTDLLTDARSVGELLTSVVVATTVLLYLHLPAASTTMLVEATRDAVQERDQRRTVQALAAHDLRSPLAVAASALETLRTHADVLPADRIRDVTDVLDGAVRRAVDLSDDLLSESLATWDGDPSATRPLRDLVADAVAGSRIHDEDVLVEGCDFTVDVPPHRLERILVNLLDNAARHGAPPVTVQGRQLAGGWSVAVGDAGAGLPTGVDPATLFEVGVHGGSNGGGHGLGLFIVAQFADSIGATVQAERPDGGGARFVLTVPG